jgi:predicted site-specific integrase-resolvase
MSAHGGVCARVSSADQKADLARQVARGDRVGHSPTDPGRQGSRRGRFRAERARRKFLALLRDQSVHRIVVEHRDRLCLFGSEYVRAALAAQGRGSWSWTPPRSMTTWCGT